MHECNCTHVCWLARVPTPCVEARHHAATEGTALVLFSAAQKNWAVRTIPVRTPRIATQVLYPCCVGCEYALYSHTMMQALKGCRGKELVALSTRKADFNDHIVRLLEDSCTLEADHSQFDLATCAIMCWDYPLLSSSSSALHQEISLPPCQRTPLFFHLSYYAPHRLSVKLVISMLDC